MSEFWGKLLHSKAECSDKHRQIKPVYKYKYVTLYSRSIYEVLVELQNVIFSFISSVTLVTSNQWVKRSCRVDMVSTKQNICSFILKYIATVQKLVMISILSFSIVTYLTDQLKFRVDQMETDLFQPATN